VIVVWHKLTSASLARILLSVEGLTRPKGDSNSASVSSAQPKSFAHSPRTGDSAMICQRSASVSPSPLSRIRDGLTPSGITDAPRATTRLPQFHFGAPRNRGIGSPVNPQ